MLVALEELLGLDRVVEVADQRRVRGLVEVLDAQLVLDELDAQFVHADDALLDVDLVVEVGLHHRREPGELGVPVGAAVGRPGDDERGAGLVDQDGVDLVDDRVVVLPLDRVLEAHGHVVAQVVEPEFPVGAVGDVGAVGRAPLVGRHLAEDHADIQAEEAVHAAHLLGVALGQVLVDGDDVHALAGQRVEVGGQHRGQRLALAGLHLGDVAEVQRRATHDLHVEVPLAEHPPRRLADHGERLGHDVVEVFLAGGKAVPELFGLGPKFGVGQLRGVVGQGVDVVSHPLEALDHAAFAETEQLRQHAVLPFSSLR